MRAADTTNCLVIRRILSAESGSNTVLCRPNRITVLSDDDGFNMPIYQKALSGETIEDTIILEYNGLNFDPISQCRIGFGEKLPEGIGIREYFAQIGIPENEIEAIIDSCDLRKYIYDTCSQLSATHARQVQLIGALRGRSQIVLLNDPFQPFSGRWREFFAEEFTKAIESSNRMLVVMNLSFIPQSWQQKEVIHYANISKILPHKKPKLEAVKNPEDELKTILAATPETLERQATATLKIAVPEPLQYAFQSTSDFIFEPLAQLVKHFGRYGAVGMILGIAILMIIGTLIMVPNLRHLQGIQKELAARFSSPPPEHISNEPVQQHKLFAKDEQKAKSNSVLEIVPLDPSAPVVSEVSSEKDLEAFDSAATQPTDIQVNPINTDLPMIQGALNVGDGNSLDSTPQQQDFLVFSPQCLVHNNDYNLWSWGDALELEAEHIELEISEVSSNLSGVTQ